MRLIISFFKLPFWVFLGLAGGLFYFGEISHRDTLAKNQDMAQALAGPRPNVVRLADFSRDRDIALAGEITVRAAVDPAHIYVLSKGKKPFETVRYLYILFDPAESGDERPARAAMVLTEDANAAFVDTYIPRNRIVSISGAQTMTALTLNGRAEMSPDMASTVENVFAQQKLTKSTDFIFIDPFVHGRAAGLTPTLSADDMRGLLRGGAIFAGLIGLLKLVAHRRRKTAQVAAEVTAKQEVAEPEISGSPKSRKLLYVSALSLVAIGGYTLYSGLNSYVILGVCLSLAVFASAKLLARGTRRKTRQSTNDDHVLAKVQAATLSEPPLEIQSDTAEEASEPTAPRPGRRLGLNILNLRRTQPKEEEMQTDLEEMKMPDLTEPSDELRKSRFSLPLPRLGRKKSEPETAETESVTPEIATDVAAPEEKPKRGFSLSLPILSRKKADASNEEQVAAIPEAPMKKANFQSAELFAQEAGEDAKGLPAKMQKLFARLAPAERTPKAFVGRPDPFDRLASEVQRKSAR